MIGLDLYTVHPDGALCSDTTGVYVRHGQWAGGVLNNSDCRTGAWGAWAPETNTLTVGPLRLKAGMLLGLISGYRAADVLPLASVSLAASLSSSAWWARVSYLPKPPGGASSGVHFSIERPF